MFKKLRVKFIAITMVMVAVVMALAFTVVCIVEYQRSYSVVQTALADAVEGAADTAGGAHRPPFAESGNPPAKPGEGQSTQSTSSSTASQPVSIAFPSPLPMLGLLSPNIAYALERPAGTLGQQAEALERQAEPQPGGQAGGRQQPYGRQNDPNQPPAPYESRDAWQEPNQGQDDDFDEQSQQGGEGQRAQGDSDDADDQDDQDDWDDRAGQQAGGDSRQPSNPDGGYDPGAFGEAASDAADAVTLDDDGLSDATPPVIGNREGSVRASSSLVPVAVYSVSSTGKLNVVPQVTTASISEDLLVEAAALALESDEGYGTFSELGLHYYKAVKGNRTYLAFADTSYTDSWKSLAVVLLLAGLGILVVFFIISLFYSKWSLRPMKEAWDSQRQFVADASHDLKTPLTVILANTSILLKHPDHTIASESQWVESTQAEAENMQGLVNEMLELAQLEAGQQVNVVFEPVDFSDLVDGETLLFDSMALERDCAFDCSIEGGVQVSGNAQQLQKMVSTLVENAFKYVDGGGSIDVTLRKSGKSALFKVRNTGSVISPEDLPHIFDRFYRTDKARTSETGGFGLGLAIAREIARAHGGDISCTSSEADGTAFTVTVPLS